MHTELARTVISAISALSEMVGAYRLRSESNKVFAELQTEKVGPASDPWRWNAETTLISNEELDQMVANTEASPEAGKVLASVVPDEALREILKRIDDETSRLRESIAEPSRSKARRQKDIEHAETEICLQLKAIKGHNANVISDVPKRTLARAWQQHRCS